MAKSVKTYRFNFSLLQSFVALIHLLKPYDKDQTFHDIMNMHFQDTALHIAGSLGQTAAVELLLTLGAIFELNKEDKNFLDLAVENKHSEIAFAVVRHERY